ncbi:hypothetical protein NOF04DRAFT_1278710 [Fusarium oxysporum II5]|nr:hypothetical protein NOF04DRAFT_1278710 [Fusarium oxysporum II5]
MLFNTALLGAQAPASARVEGWQQAVDVHILWKMPVSWSWTDSLNETMSFLWAGEGGALLATGHWLRILCSVAQAGRDAGREELMFSIGSKRDGDRLKCQISGRSIEMCFFSW